MIELTKLWAQFVVWLKKHWALIGAAAAAVAAVYVEAKTHKLPSVAEREKSAEDTQGVEQELHQVVVEQGSAAAHQKVLNDYQASIGKLTDAQHMQAAKLLNDPEALAKFLATNTDKAS